MTEPAPQVTILKPAFAMSVQPGVGLLVVVKAEPKPPRPNRR